MVVKEFQRMNDKQLIPMTYGQVRNLKVVVTSLSGCVLVKQSI